MNSKVQDRMAWAHHNLAPVEPRYRIVFQRDDDRPAEVVTPAPRWLAAAMHGGLIPTIDCYQALRIDEKGRVLNGHVVHERTQPAMTEEEAMVYLLMKDVPVGVWGAPRSNARRYAFVPAHAVPPDRSLRNAWRLKP